MQQIRQIGAQGVYDIGDAPSLKSFNLSTPAGWAMVWWGLSASIILIMLLMM